MMVTTVSTRSGITSGQFDSSHSATLCEVIAERRHS
jgi:hypothetical protein